MAVEKQLKKKLEKTVKRAKKEEANLEKVQKEAKEEYTWFRASWTVSTTL